MLRKETIDNIEKLIQELTWERKKSKDTKEKFKLNARIEQLRLLKCLQNK
ncbi:hypothetical protein BX659_10498 [Orenia metallireducens]|jgi:hypothetical protein|uniref:Uncharacterized protein n=1 Tax=Orenia metallireducens TaxID=1413210 RepID=A0A285GBC8_9FIRM|nr:hypothetical protein [Orenia metallireducens]PRX32549.1 hypothetical protein BX659_10498 [Orenia metallireducens]SNY20882.1 hypothetical protein SAMN06265827_10650 [Orenia metallireducens]